MVLALRLGRGLRVRYETVNNHLPSGHHICVLIYPGFYWLGYLGGGVWCFNKHVDFAAKGYMFC